jgi:hypothetical protein
MEIIIFWLACAVVANIVAHYRGSAKEYPLLWAFLAPVFGPLALFAAWFMVPTCACPNCRNGVRAQRGTMQTCPYCDTQFCWHCTRAVEESVPAHDSGQQPPASGTKTENVGGEER